jgi:mono/diheme cytochrome c family protein
MKFKFSATVFAILMCTSLIMNAQTKRKSQSAAKKASVNSSTADASSILAGKKIFVQYCLSCHQADGGGVQRLNPPLIKTSYVLGDKNKLINIILKGFSEDVEINGEYYSNTMPAHDFLKDQEIADVLTYVRNSFGNKASAIKVAEVTSARAAVKK